MIYNQEAGMSGLGVLPLSADPISWGIVSNAYQRLLGREPESRETMAFWADWLTKNDHNASLLDAQIKGTQEYIQAHANNQTPASPGLPSFLPSVPSTVFGVPTIAVAGGLGVLGLLAVMKSRR
jgi:hypothetical protein